MSRTTKGQHTGGVFVRIETRAKVGDLNSLSNGQDFNCSFKSLRVPLGNLLPLIKSSQLEVDVAVGVVQVFGIDNCFVYFFGGTDSKWSPW